MEEILRKLVGFPTLSDDAAANHAALDYVADFLAARGMHVRRMPRTGRMYEALLASTRPDNALAPATLLAAHIDVMPAPPEMFTLQKTGGKYVGRGVLDMKCAIAAYLHAVDALRGRLAEYDFAVLITSDEEIGGRDGVNGVVELIAEGLRPQFVILPDGGENWQLEAASNGYMHLTLETRGLSGHSSRPWLGDNAAAKLVATLAEYQTHFQGQGPETDMLNIATIKTSDVPANQIPDFATAEISVRLRTPASTGRLLSLLRDVCAKHGVDIIERTTFEAITNDLNEPHVRRYAAVTEHVTGVPVRGFHSYAGSDARFFAALGIPYANAYPPGGGHHSDHEWLAEEALPQLGDIIQQYLAGDGLSPRRNL